MFLYKRILILGNSGSGKTWLGQQLSETLGLTLYHMDDIRWRKGVYEVKRSAEEIDIDLKHLLSQEKWVFEGVFGQMAECVVEKVGLFIWLALPWEDCHNNLLERGPQFETILRDLQARESALQSLTTWASTYESRNDKNAYIFHKQLFERFEGEKRCFTTRNEVQKFTGLSQFKSME